MNQSSVVSEEKITYKGALKQTQYMKLLVANIISRFGDSIDAIAFTWLVYAITGEASWSAIIFAMNQIPSVLLQPFAGAFVEGWNKKRVMVVTDIIRGFVVVGLAVLYVLELLNPAILVVFTITISTVEAFRIPASTAVIPKIIDMRYYTHCTSLNSAISTVMQLIGIGAAGMIIGAFGVETAIIIDGITFFLSAFMILFVKVKEEKLVKESLTVKKYFGILGDGCKYLKKERIIINFVVLAVFANAFVVPFNALQTPLVTEVLGQGSEMLSVLSIAMMAAMLLGTIIYPVIAEKVSVRIQVACGGIAMGAGFGLYVLAGQFQDKIVILYALVILASVVIGLGVTIVNSCLNVQFMKCVDEEYLARAGSIFSAAACAASPVVSFLIGGLTSVISVATMFIISGALCIALFVLVAVLKIRLEK
ncbi:MAG: MFS transporter [Lachnospiraceae bacterium]|nr:MFS transporter [Lachnospiraceae bacterium]